MELDGYITWNKLKKSITELTRNKSSGISDVKPNSLIEIYNINLHSLFKYIMYF